MAPLKNQLERTDYFGCAQVRVVLKRFYKAKMLKVNTTTLVPSSRSHGSEKKLLSCYLSYFSVIHKVHKLQMYLLRDKFLFSVFLTILVISITGETASSTTHDYLSIRLRARVFYEQTIARRKRGRVV